MCAPPDKKVYKHLYYDSKFLPLYFYRNLSIYTMRSDSLDRFGTTLEKRFSKKEILLMLNKSNFKNIKFRNDEPFWTVICQKKN